MSDHLTPEDLRALWLKAIPELLDGWCGPTHVSWLDGFNEEGVWWFGRYLTPTGDWPEEDIWDLVTAIHLDLARAECRDRVARVLAGRMPHRVHTATTAPSWCYRGWWDLDARADRRPWRVCFGGSGVGGPSHWAGVVGLDGIDPRDHRLLPDGSRYVDALALKLVAEEVLRG